MASVTLVMLSGDQCDTHYDTGKIDLAPRARRSVSTGSPTDTSSKTPCLSRLPAEPLGWNSPSANGVSDPQPILGVYEVSVEPIIGCPQGPKCTCEEILQSFSKGIPRFLSPSGKRLSDREWSPLKGPQHNRTMWAEVTKPFVQISNKKLYSIREASGEKQCNSILTGAAKVPPVKSLKRNLVCTSVMFPVFIITSH